MKAHTQQFKENLVSLGKEVDAKIIYTVNGTETELDSDVLASVIPHYKGSLLKSVMKQVDIVSDVDIPLNTEINVQFGMRYNTENYEYIDYGNYIIFSSEKQEDTKNYKIIAYDKMLYAMKDYEELEITYPITIRDYINAICTKIGIEFANSNDTFANYDEEITQDLYKDLGYTYRDILDELAQVTASTICINEDDELEIRYINDTVLDSEEVEGTEFTLTSEKAKLSGLELEGQTTQETTNGYNIYVGANDLYSNISNINQFTKEDLGDNQLKLTKTTDGTASPRFYVTLEANQTYTISCKVKGNATKCIMGYWENTPGMVEKVTITPNTSDYQTMTFTYTSGGGNTTTGENPRIFFRNSTETFRQLNQYIIIKDFMIEKGSTAHNYEPYTNGASPNPNYPQNINVVTGLQKINITGNNLFNEVWEQGSISTTGQEQASTTSIRSVGYTEVEPNTTYTITRTKTGYFPVLREYNASKTFVGNLDPFSGHVQDTTMTFTTTSNTYYIRFVDNESEDRNKIMLTKGTQVVPYEPYKNKSYEINLGKNLLDIPDQTNTNSGLTSVISNNVLTTTGTTSATFHNATEYQTNNFDIGTYTFSIENSVSFIVRLRFYNQDNSTAYTFDIPANSKSVLIDLPTKPAKYRILYSGLTNNTQYDVEIKYQLEKGSQATSYSPYFTPIELNKISTYKDYIFKNKIDSPYYNSNFEVDKWLLHKEIGKVIANGSENWRRTGTNTSGSYYFFVDEILSNILYSNNRFIGMSNMGVTSNAYQGIQGFDTIFYNNVNRSRFYSNTTKAMSEADFKTWMSSNNLIVYYVLANPTTEEITSSNYPELYSQLKAIDKAQTYQGTTNIISSFPISFSYVSEMETIDEDFIKNTRADFGEKYGPINSIVLSRSAESDNIYLQDEESIEENGLCEIKIKDNQIMNDNTRDRFLPDLLEYLSNVEYYINDFESIGITYLDLLDRYKVVIDDKSYYCVMLNDEVEIDDGLNEIIYTEKPKENQTDYKKASTSDKLQKQTYLIVDKQAQRIDAVVSTQDEFEDSLSQLSVTVDGINTKVELNYDFVRETSGNNYISVDDIQQGGIVELKITGTAINNDFLRLHITNNVPEYIDLPITTILKQSDSLYDILTIESIYNQETELYELHVFIDKKLDYIENQIVTHLSTTNFLLNQDSTKITTENGEDLLLEDYVEGKQDLGIISIPIQEGQHTFSIDGFNSLDYYLKYAVLNNITSEFALKKHIISEINQTPEQITISADKVSLEGKTINLTSDTIQIESDNFKVDNEGNMTCNSAIMNNATINNAFFTSINETQDWPSILLGTNESYSNGIYNGIYPSLINMENLAQPEPDSGEGMESVEPQIRLWWEFLETGTTIGATGITTDGDIVCQSLYQTSLEEKKKNIKIFKNALEEIKNTDIYQYNLINEDDKNKKHLGFVIGKDRKYSKIITSVDKEGNEIGVDTYSMTSLCLQAIKEQQEQIETLKKQIDILKGGK